MKRPTHTNYDVIVHQSGQVIDVLVKSAYASRQQGSEQGEHGEPHDETRTRQDIADFHLAFLSSHGTSDWHGRQVTEMPEVLRVNHETDKASSGEAQVASAWPHMTSASNHSFWTLP